MSLFNTIALYYIGTEFIYEIIYFFLEMIYYIHFNIILKLVND